MMRLQKINPKGDEWDRLHPNDKYRRIQIKLQ